MTLSTDDESGLTERRIKQALSLAFSVPTTQFKQFEISFDSTTNLMVGGKGSVIGYVTVNLYDSMLNYPDAVSLLAALESMLQTAMSTGSFATYLSSECGCTASLTTYDMVLGRNYPTLMPTGLPTHQPSHNPTALPTYFPSQSPTPEPSHLPTQPSPAPTAAPSVFPSPAPTPEPSSRPTHSPTPQPTHLPTMEFPPSPLPTATPTRFPTAAPSHAPTTFEEKRKFRKHHPRHNADVTNMMETVKTKTKVKRASNKAVRKNDALRLDIVQLDMETTVSAEVQARADESLKIYEMFTQEVDALRSQQTKVTTSNGAKDKKIVMEKKAKRMPVSIFDVDPKSDTYRELNLDAVDTQDSTEAWAGDRFSAFSAIGGALAIIGVVAAFVSLSGNDPTAAYERRKGYADLSDEFSSPL
jgi:hypothetical protein